MVVWVVEWGCIFEMDVDGVVAGQVVSHYILAEPACYLGSSSVEQAFGAALVEQGAMVAVEQVVEEKERKECCTGATTLDEVHSTKDVAERRGEMDEQLVEHDIEEDTTKEGVWTRKDEQGNPKRAWKWLDRGYNRSGMSLAFPLGKFWVHVASFGS